MLLFTFIIQLMVNQLVSSMTLCTNSYQNTCGPVFHLPCVKIIFSVTLPNVNLIICANCSTAQYAQQHLMVGF